MAAVGYDATQESTYTATSQVLLYPSPGNPLSPEAASGSGNQLTTAMETELGIVRTPEVAQVASANVGREIPTGAERLKVRVPAGAQVVEIGFTSSSPDRAAAGSQAFSEAFLDYREQRSNVTQEALLQTLRTQADVADENLRRAAAEAVDGDGSSYASQEVQLYTDRLAQLNDRISAIEAVGTEPGRLISPRSCR